MRTRKTCKTPQRSAGSLKLTNQTKKHEIGSLNAEATKNLNKNALRDISYKLFYDFWTLFPHWFGNILISGTKTLSKANALQIDQLCKHDHIAQPEMGDPPWI